MKKILILPLILIISVIFAGCSLAPSNNSKSGESSFIFSKSIWKSTDGGKTWKVKNKGEGKANTTNANVLSLIINPKNTRNIFVGLRQGGILETINGGDTWRFMNFKSGKVYGLALDTKNNTLYASGVWEKTGKIFKTLDDGKHWKEIYTSPSAGPLIISLVIDPKNPKILYATTSDKEALKSTDGGTSWKNIYLASAPILKIAIDSANSNLIYGITNSGTVLKSTNGGANFENITKKVNQSVVSFGGTQFNKLATNPSHSHWVYLAGKGGIILSKNSGETWQKISTLNNPEKFPIDALAINPKNADDLIYGAAQATYKSIDSGADWITSQFDIKMNARALIYNPDNPNILYLGFTK